MIFNSSEFLIFFVLFFCIYFFPLNKNIKKQLINDSQFVSDFITQKIEGNIPLMLFRLDLRETLAISNKAEDGCY